MKKLLILLTTITSLLLLISCDEYFFNGDIAGMSEDWIAISNIDGTELEYICAGSETPIFVTNLENEEQDLILLSSTNKIELMNLDGSNRHTILDSVGKVSCLSDDRTKMLFVKDGDIFMAKVDGTEFQNITNTPDINEKYPAFSPNGEEIVYTYKTENTHSFLRILDLQTGEINDIYDTDTVLFHRPVFKNDYEILYRVRNELHQVNIIDSTDFNVISNDSVYDFLYHRDSNQLIVEFESKTSLIDYSTLESKHDFMSSLGINEPRINFGKNGNHIVLDYICYDIDSNKENSLEMYKKISINFNETKVIGIDNRR